MLGGAEARICASAYSLRGEGDRLRASRAARDGVARSSADSRRACVPLAPSRCARGRAARRSRTRSRASSRYGASGIETDLERSACERIVEQPQRARGVAEEPGHVERLVIAASMQRRRAVAGLPPERVARPSSSAWRRRACPCSRASWLRAELRVDARTVRRRDLRARAAPAGAPRSRTARAPLQELVAHDRTVDVRRERLRACIRRRRHAESTCPSDDLRPREIVDSAPAPRVRPRIARTSSDSARAYWCWYMQQRSPGCSAPPCCSAGSRAAARTPPSPSRRPDACRAGSSCRAGGSRSASLSRSRCAYAFS